MGKAQVQENYAVHYGTEEEKVAYKKRLLGVFFVNTLEWKRSVVRRGAAAAIEAIDYLREQFQADERRVNAELSKLL